jgi:hypothetical protein
VAFESLRAEFALGFRRAAANLPATLVKRRIADHFLARRDEVQQPVSRLAFCFASHCGTPLDDVLPGHGVSPVLEHVYQCIGSRAALGRCFAKNLAPRAMHAFPQVIEVQAQPVQLHKVQLHLVTNPRRSIYESHVFAAARAGIFCRCDTILGAPRHVDGIVLLSFQDTTSRSFQFLSQSLATEFHLRRAMPTVTAPARR